MRTSFQLVCAAIVSMGLGEVYGAAWGFVALGITLFIVSATP